MQMRCAFAGMRVIRSPRHGRHRDVIEMRTSRNQRAHQGILVEVHDVDRQRSEVLVAQECCVVRESRVNDIIEVQRAGHVAGGRRQGSAGIRRTLVGSCRRIGGTAVRAAADENKLICD